MEGPQNLGVYRRNSRVDRNEACRNGFSTKGIEFFLTTLTGSGSLQIEGGSADGPPRLLVGEDVGSIIELGFLFAPNASAVNW